MRTTGRSRFIKTGVILDDSSATNSRSASCFNRLPEVGTSAGLVRYGEMSAVLELRRDEDVYLGEQDSDGEIDAEKAGKDPADGSAGTPDKRDDEVEIVDVAKAFKCSECTF